MWYMLEKQQQFPLPSLWSSADRKTSPSHSGYTNPLRFPLNSTSKVASPAKYMFRTILLI